MVHKKKIVNKHPDHSGELDRLMKIIGQLNGIEKMIVERRYCPEILQQIRAADSAVRALEVAILQKHLDMCIRTAAKSDSEKVFSNKLGELLKLIRS